MSAAHRPWLSALFLLALLARLPGLGRSLWYDELFTLARFTGSASDALTRQVEANNHPLASLLAWAAQAVATSEVGLRAPFVLLGAAAAPALAWSAARALGPATGWLAGALAAVAPLHVALSQQVRGYAGLLLATSLLVGLVPRALRAERVTGALAACAALGLWSHATLLLPLAGWIALAALAPRLGLATPAGRAVALRGLVAGTAAGLLLLAPVVSRLFKFARRELGASGEGDRFGARELAELLGGTTASWFEGLLPMALAWLALLGAARAWRGSRLTALALLVPVVALAPLVALGAPAYSRFALFALPALLALAAHGLATTRGRGPRVAVLAVVVALAAARVASHAHDELQDYRGAAHLARAQVGEDGLVLGAGEGGGLLRAYDGDAVQLDWDDLDAALARRQPLAVVVPFPAWTPAAARAILEERCGVVLLPGQVSPIAVWIAR
jgi:hypothetical protein